MSSETTQTVENEPTEQPQGKSRRQPPLAARSARRSEPPDQDPTEPRTARGRVIEPFGIEADEPRNGDLLIRTIPGLRLRSAIHSSRPTADRRTGEMRVPKDQADALGAIPPVPGMQLHVNPRTGEYRVIDPLHADKDLCRRISDRIKEGGHFRIREVRGVPPQTGQINTDDMKTLLREIRWIVDAGHARECKGRVPEMSEIDAAPGRYLLNPGLRTQTLQPRYEDQWDDWLQQLARSGG